MTPIWVVVPFSRPANRAIVEANFARQSYPLKRLCVVENGPAEGSGIDADLVLRSFAHQADAKNTGTRAIVEREPDALVAYFDDDDWYGPDHLAELAEIIASGRADVAGRLPGFVRLRDGLHLFSWGRPESYVRWVLGATLVTRARESVPFRRVPQDDTEWIREMLECGARLCAGRSRQFVYNRASGSHVWRTNDVLLRRGFGPSICFGDAPDDTATLENPVGGQLLERPTDREVFAALRAFHGAEDRAHPHGRFDGGHPVTAAQE